MAEPRTARGSFEVRLAPQEPEGDDPSQARLLIDKNLEGDLVATGQGQMLSCRTPTEGSAGYVAVERITGTLHGRSGSFALQHFAFLDRGAPEQTVRVVPDSGTDDLTGITGTFRIDIRDGKHFYEFDYMLPG